MNRLPLYLHILCSAVLLALGIFWPVAQAAAGRLSPLGLILGFGLMASGLFLGASTVKDYRDGTL